MAPIIALGGDLAWDRAQGQRRRPVPAVPPSLPSLCSARPLRDVVPPAGTVSPRLAKKLKCAIFAEFTVLPSLAPHLAFHLPVPHTHHKQAEIAVVG